MHVAKDKRKTLLLDVLNEINDLIWLKHSVVIGLKAKGQA